MADPRGVIADADADAASTGRTAAYPLDQTEFSEPAKLHGWGSLGSD
jgi:hypothetical protein